MTDSVKAFVAVDSKCKDYFSSVAVGIEISVVMNRLIHQIQKMFSSSEQKGEKFSVSVSLFQKLQFMHKALGFCRYPVNSI